MARKLYMSRDLRAKDKISISIIIPWYTWKTISKWEWWVRGQFLPIFHSDVEHHVI